MTDIVITTTYFSPRPEGAVFVGRILGKDSRLERRNNREVEISNSVWIDLNIAGRHETVLLDPSQFEPAPPWDPARADQFCATCQGYGLVELEEWGSGESLGTCHSCACSGLK